MKHNTARTKVRHGAYMFKNIQSRCSSKENYGGHGLFPGDFYFPANGVAFAGPRGGYPMRDNSWCKRRWHVKPALFGHGKMPTMLEHECVVTSSSGTSMPPIVL